MSDPVPHRFCTGFLHRSGLGTPKGKVKTGAPVLHVFPSGVPGEPVQASLWNETAKTQDADPAAAYPTKAARRAAWAAWEAAGAPWPPPAGLVSAALDQCQGDGRGRWR